MRYKIYFIISHKYLTGRSIKMENRWFSVDEMAKYLGVSNDTVYNWLYKRGMPGHHVGRLWKFKTAEVDKWVKSGTGKVTIKPAHVKRSKK